MFWRSWKLPGILDGLSRNTDERYQRDACEKCALTAIASTYSSRFGLHLVETASTLVAMASTVAAMASTY